MEEFKKLSEGRQEPSPEQRAEFQSLERSENNTIIRACALIGSSQNWNPATRNAKAQAYKHSWIYCEKDEGFPPEGIVGKFEMKDILVHFVRMIGTGAQRLDASAVSVDTSSTVGQDSFHHSVSDNVSAVLGVMREGQMAFWIEKQPEKHPDEETYEHQMHFLHNLKNFDDGGVKGILCLLPVEERESLWTSTARGFKPELHRTPLGMLVAYNRREFPFYTFLQSLALDICCGCYKLTAEASTGASSTEPSITTVLGKSKNCLVGSELWEKLVPVIGRLSEEAGSLVRQDMGGFFGLA